MNKIMNTYQFTLVFYDLPADVVGRLCMSILDCTVEHRDNKTVLWYRRKGTTLTRVLFNARVQLRRLGWKTLW